MGFKRIHEFFNTCLMLCDLMFKVGQDSFCFFVGCANTEIFDEQLAVKTVADFISGAGFEFDFLDGCHVINQLMKSHFYPCFNKTLNKRLPIPMIKTETATTTIMMNIFLFCSDDFPRNSFCCFAISAKCSL